MIFLALFFGNMGLSGLMELGLNPFALAAALGMMRQPHESWGGFDAV